MSEPLSTVEWDPEGDVPKPVTRTPAEAELQMPRYGANLFPCDDCGHYCSRQAEHCPQCGRFYQRFEAGEVKIDRRGWVWTIAGGIWWAMVFPWVLVFILLVVLVLLGLLGDAVAVLVGLLVERDQLGQHPGEGVDLVAAQLRAGGESWRHVREHTLEAEHEAVADLPLRRGAAVAAIDLGERIV